MSFLAPIMLWGSLAAGIPIALHFFYRSRYKTVPWAAMKFLLTSIEQTSRRLRFQELLLLLLRTALLLLLAFSLARPSLKGAGRGADAVDAVILIDSSLSMTASAGVLPRLSGNDPYLVALQSFARPDRTVTCFDRARAAAIAVVSALPPQSTVQVIATTDRAQLLGPRIASQTDQARQLIEAMTPTHLGSDFQPAIRLAAEILERGPSPGKEIYLISDMQRQGWQARQGELTELLGSLKERAELHLVHCLPLVQANVAVVGVTAQTTLRPGERTDFAVMIRHSGSKPATNLTVSLEVNGKNDSRESRPLSEIGPGETRAIILSAVIDKPGRHVLTASVGPDELEGDNRYDLVLQVADQSGVLLVDGTPDDRDPRRSGAFFLEHALSPLPVSVTSALRAVPRDLTGKDLCILVNARLEATGDKSGDLGDRLTGPSLSADFIRALQPFVKDGGGLLVFAGDRVEPDRYNAWLYDRIPLLPYRIVKEEKRTQAAAFRVDRAGALAEPFTSFRNDQAYSGIDRIESLRLLTLDVQPKEADARVLLRCQSGEPVVASRRRAGQGEVMFFTTSASDPAWSNWFATTGFVPFVQLAANHLMKGRPQELNRTAGQPLVWQVPSADAGLAYDLLEPTGIRERIGYAESLSGRPVLSSSEISRAGLYRILPGGTQVTPDTPVFAVVPDLSDTEDLDYLTPARIDAQLGFSPVHVTAGDIATDFSAADHLSSEWTPWLLLLLLAFVCFEMLLAWHCDRAPGGVAPAIR